MTTILLPCNVQRDYKDNLVENIVNFLDFYSLNLWIILLGGLGWSSHTVIYLRKQDQLWDITLVTKDDKEFKAHRNILSAASPFFSKLLQSDMKENQEGIVQFEEISGGVMDESLEFMYTVFYSYWLRFVKERVRSNRSWLYLITNCNKESFLYGRK